MSIVRTNTSGRIVKSSQPVSVFVVPRSTNHESETNRPSMNTSPCAKLMSSMIP